MQLDHICRIYSVKKEFMNIGNNFGIPGIEVLGKTIVGLEGFKKNKTSRYPYKGSSVVLSIGLVFMRPTTTGPGLR